MHIVENTLNATTALQERSKLSISTSKSDREVTLSFFKTNSPSVNFPGVSLKTSV